MHAHVGVDLPGKKALGSLALLMLAALSPVRGVEEPTPPPADLNPAPASEEKPPSRDERGPPRSPWAFSLGLYTFLPAVDSEFTTGNREAEVDVNLFDILDATKGVPLSIGGRLEAYWKRLGISVDSNYFLLRFREQDFTVGNVLSGSAEVTTQMTFLEYSAMFRVFGAPPADRPEWAVKTGPPRVDVYAGGRTIWVKNEIEPQVLPDTSTEKIFTSPLVGARVEVDLGPRWFFRVDGNVGGFSVDHVRFAAEGLAVFGLRMTPLHVRTELWLGYEVLYFEMEDGGPLDRLESDILLHGPALGLTFCW